VRGICRKASAAKTDGSAIVGVLERIADGLTSLLGREQPAPQVSVSVPKQPAPVVNVENTVDVPRPQPVRVKKQRNGDIVYVPEPESAEES
jgi:hypothetical protein